MKNGQRPTDLEVPQHEPSERIPVPKYIRTDRTKPRIFAAIVAAAWVVLYVLGTQALARQYQGAQLISDYALEVGEHFWLIKRSADDEQCTGVVHAIMSLKPTPTAEIDGAIFLPVFQQDIPVNFSLKGMFSPVFLLDKTDAHLSAGGLRVDLNSLGRESKSADITVTSQDVVRTLNVPLPHPIYITETISNHYALRLPASAREQIELLRSRVTTRPGAAAPVAKETDAEKIAECREHLKQPRPSTAPYDLGSYLQVLGVNKDLPIIAELGKANHD
ncbi:MAG: hypothetical protein KDD66_01285 [Bdellovibrionales bacterium]|nr:hypothetical protein [Bdellovibrionales bacterium]